MEGGQYYDPIDYRCLDLILSEFPASAATDVFLDYGTGLGRAIIATGNSGRFRRVIGVENNRQLLMYCRQHLMRVERLCNFRSQIELIEQDAAKFDVSDDVTCILIYNFFVEQALADRVLSKLHESLQRRPRCIHVVYAPLHAHAHFLVGCSWLKKIKEIPTGFWNHISITLYQAVLLPGESAS